MSRCQNVAQHLATVLSLSLVVVIFVTSLGGLVTVKASSPEPLPHKSDEVKRASKVSPLLDPRSHSPRELVQVIAEISGLKSGRLKAFLNRSDVHLGREMKTFNLVTLTLPVEAVAELASFPEVLHVSANDEVTALGHVSATTGLDAGKSDVAGAVSGTINGTGIGIAIVDSGIDVNHSQFSGGRVLASVDFTG